MDALVRCQFSFRINHTERRAQCTSYARGQHKNSCFKVKQKNVQPEPALEVYVIFYQKSVYVGKKLLNYSEVG